MKKTGLKKGNKITKLIAALLCAGMLLTGCGNSGSKKIEFKGDNTGNKTTEGGAFDSFGGGSQSEMTLSEYTLANQPCILYVHPGRDNSVNENDSSTPESHQPPAKDEVPEGFYYFHDNMVTMYDTKLTWGDISRMTDEEIISGSEAVESATDTEYKFVVFTDATGNNFDGEAIVVKTDGGYIYEGHHYQPYFMSWMTTTYGVPCQIYDASFVGWNATCPPSDSWSDSTGRPTFWLKKVDESVSISLDKPDSPNVVVDPECNDDRKIKDSIFD